MTHATSTLASFAIAPGCVLAGKYRVDGVLGSGGMATVLSATHLQLREAVAIKVLHRDVLSRPGSLERFLREARVAMRLRSEHVARVFDIGTMDDGTPFIVMELLLGADFGSLVSERGPLPVHDAVDFVLQACEALVEAHAAGVVHRDLKPANLFLCTGVDGSPFVKVLDFGVSKVADDSSPLAQSLDRTAPPSRPGIPALASPAHAGAAPTVTMTHAFLGSPRYMAPEQIHSARDVDRRADVWALGVILHELVSGLPPFRGETLAALCECILDRCAAPLRGPDGPLPELEEALAGCFAKDPSARYQDVRAFAEAIVRFGSPEARTSFERIVRMTAGRAATVIRRVAAPSGDPTLGSDRHAENAVSRSGIVRKLRRRRAIRWPAAVAVTTAALIAGGAFVAPRLMKRSAPTTVASTAPAPGTVRELPRTTPASIAIAASPAFSASPAPTPIVTAPSRETRALETSGAPRPRPRPAVPRSATTSEPAPAIAASTTPARPDPLGLDTGALFMDRR